MNYKEAISYLNKDELFLMELYRNSKSEMERDMIQQHRETLIEAITIVDELGRLRIKKENEK